MYAYILGAAANYRIGLWRSFQIPSGSYLRLFFDLSAGIALEMALLFLLGALGLLTLPGLLIAATMALLASMPSTYAQIANYIPSAGPFSSQKMSLTECAGLAAIFLIIASRANTPPGYWDDTMYHLPLARYYVEHHGLSLSQYLRFSLLPQNMELLFSAGLILHNVVIAQALATIPIFIVSVGLIGAALFIFESIAMGYVAIAALLAAPVVHAT